MSGGELGPVLAAYGLTADRAVPAGGTAGRTWRVEAAGESWFVRRRGERTSGAARVRFDHGLRRHLHDAGFCAVPPCPNLAGETCTLDQGGSYEVYPWVEGVPLTPALADAARGPAARALAGFHQAAADYAGECEALLPQFGHFPGNLPARDGFDHPAAFLDAIDHLTDAYGTPANRGALQATRDRVAAWGEGYGPLRDSLPRTVIHGDYNAANLLFTPAGRVAGVFDYDWAWRDVRVRDVGEGVFFFGARRAEATDGSSIWSLTACPRFELEPMVEFLASYHEAAPLTPDELRAVPLALLGRWVACRTEGVMKVPAERRAEFFLAAFHDPFEWAAKDGEALTERLR